MKYISTIILILNTGIASAQSLPANFNLVPNPSFELNPVIGVPLDTSFNNNNRCWISANANLSPIFTAQIFPFTQPNTGSFFGFWSLGHPTYIPSTQQWQGVTQYRHFFETKLLEPLVAGETYYFSIHPGVYKSTVFTGSTLANIGAYFSDTEVHLPNSFTISLTPQIRFTSWDVPLFDTFVYTKLTAAYTATGGEQYLTIGNFDSMLDFEHVYVDPIAISLDYTQSLYRNYFDDVSLVRDTTQPMISLAEFNIGNDTLLCPGQSITIGGEEHFFHYWWNTGDTTRFITINQPGTYWCTVDFGCSTYTDTIQILAPQNVAFNIADTIVCPGQPVTFLAPTGFPQYLWSNGSTSQSITTASPGTYWLQVSSACTSYTDTFTLTNQNIPVPPFSIADTIFCPGQVMYTASAPQGHSSYLWSNGDTTQTTTLTTAGSYWVQVSNLCGNTTTDTFTISLHTSTPLQLPISDTTICAGQSITVTAPPGYLQYQWSTGANTSTIVATNTGIYTLQVTDNCNTFSDSVLLTVVSPPTDNDLGPDRSVCSNTPVVLQSQPGYNYLWSTGETSQSITITEAGTYTATISNTCGSLSDSITIDLLPAPPMAVSISGDLSICKNGQLAPGILSAPSGPYALLWSTGETTPTITVNTVGLYSLILQNDCGSARGEVYVSGCQGIIDFPSAFSPNGDGKNDVFRAIIQDSRMIEKFQLRVYNRYGNCVYEGTDASTGWNGSRSDMGVYYYYCNYKEYGGTDQMIKGDVTLLR